MYLQTGRAGRDSTLDKQYVNGALIRMLGQLTGHTGAVCHQ